MIDSIFSRNEARSILSILISLRLAKNDLTRVMARNGRFAVKERLEAGPLLINEESWWIF